ncbi:MAG: hypothetical protein ACKV22_07900 [Bryobacteraceae bacterium]
MTRQAHRAPALRIRGWAIQGWIGDDFRDSLKESIQAIPDSIMERLPSLSIILQPRFPDPDITSRWTETEAGVEIRIATDDVSPHDGAIEILVCAGEVLWDCLDEKQRRVWFQQLRSEIDAGVAGEIDEASVREKRILLSSRVQASSGRRLERYARQSFASTAAEFCHALWHDVSVREGEGHLPAPCLRRRFELLARWFPPGRDLFAAPERAGRD